MIEIDLSSSLCEDTDFTKGISRCCTFFFFFFSFIMSNVRTRMSVIVAIKAEKDYSAEFINNLDGYFMLNKLAPATIQGKATTHVP